MFKRNVVDEKTKNKVIEIEELTKALETRLMARVDELEKQLLELQMKQKRDDGFFSMLMKTLQEWRDKDE
jgi:hypothetical protein|tara:strand:- start:40 stop:249 length:210 start_codon:yes stop_codon:yes gene_type:complete